MSRMKPGPPWILLIPCTRISAPSVRRSSSRAGSSKTGGVRLPVIERFAMPSSNGIRPKRRISLATGRAQSVSARIAFAARLEQEPGAPLGLVDPDLDEARGRDVAVLFADVVGFA